MFDSDLNLMDIVLIALCLIALGLLGYNGMTRRTPPDRNFEEGE